jgi:hypothetical protein
MIHETVIRSKSNASKKLRSMSVLPKDIMQLYLLQRQIVSNSFLVDNWKEKYTAKVGSNIRIWSFWMGG